MARPADASQQQCYFGTKEAVRLGDLVQVRTAGVLKFTGVVCSLPGVAPDRKGAIPGEARRIGIRASDGTLRRMPWVPGRVLLSQRMTLVRRDEPIPPPGSARDFNGSEWMIPDVDADFDFDD